MQKDTEPTVLLPAAPGAEYPQFGKTAALLCKLGRLKERVEKAARLQQQWSHTRPSVIVGGDWEWLTRGMQPWIVYKC